MAPEQDVQSYLAKALAMDPQYEAEEILELRAEFLGLEGASAQKDEALDRDTARKRLELMREKLWTLSVAEFKELDESLDLHLFPDLEAWRTRMLRARSYHEDFLAAVADEEVKVQAGDLLRALRRIACSPQQEAARTRENYLRKIKSEVKAKDSVRMIQWVSPGLLDLDPELFRRIAVFRRDSKLSRKTGFTVGGFILFYVIIRIFSMIHRNS